MHTVYMYVTIREEERETSEKKLLVLIFAWKLE